jgi:hypothetical protein
LKSIIVWRVDICQAEINHQDLSPLIGRSNGFTRLVPPCRSLSKSTLPRSNLDFVHPADTVTRLGHKRLNHITTLPVHLDQGNDEKIERMGDCPNSDSGNVVRRKPLARS